MNKMLKITIVLLIICIIGFGGYLVYKNILKKDDNTPVPINNSSSETKITEPIVSKSNEFTYNLILNNHAIVEKNKNYLISPYSIEIALNMLRDGANGDTKAEIDKVIGNRIINPVVIKDRVGVANAIFMRDTYEKRILSTYKDNLKNNYNAEMFTYKFDELIDAINTWVKEKTNGMIPKTVEKIANKYVLGLVNALAIDVEWQEEFKCERTKSEEFTKADGTKINVEMMHKTGYQYIKENQVEGIVLPYKKYDNSNIELEFVGLIPTGDLDSYLNNSLEKDLKNLNNLIKTPINNESVNLSLPRFIYDSGVNKFIKLLQTMGIKKAFSDAPGSLGAEFHNMVEESLDVYVSEAIHKSHIELMEKGTKAAAVTYIEITEKNSLEFVSPADAIDIKFDKPFIYLIREKNTGEMLFFGVVYEPNLWQGSTCSNK